MARQKILNSKWKRLLSVVLAGFVVIGCAGGVVSLVNKPTNKIGASQFSVGAINEQGIYVKSEKSLYTKDLIECHGLTITPDFEALGTYKVFYYGEDKNFLGSTDALKAYDGVYKRTGFDMAKYCRIMITPQAPVNEYGQEDAEFKIRFYEVSKYVGDYTITVDKKQIFAYTSDRDLIKESPVVGKSYLDSGKTGVDYVELNTTYDSSNKFSQIWSNVEIPDDVKELTVIVSNNNKNQEYFFQIFFFKEDGSILKDAYQSVLIKPGESLKIKLPVGDAKILGLEGFTDVTCNVFPF